MKLNTVNFGEINIEEKDIITFEQPIFGFEEKKRYIFMMDDSLNGEFIWLQSVDDGGLCFVLANPCLLGFEYNPVFSENISEIIGHGTYEMWLIMVVADNFGDSTVNLKSPVVVNLDERKGAQFISEDDLMIKYKLFENIKE